MASAITKMTPDTMLRGLKGESCLGSQAADRAFHWLLEEGRREPGLEDVVAGLVRELTSGGLPLHRLNISMRTLHPQIAAVGYVWTRATGKVEITPRDYSVIDSAAYRESPFRLLYEFGERVVRRRLVGPQAKLDFPVLNEFREAGATDYVLFALDGLSAALGISTDRADGFSDNEIDGFMALLPLLSLIVEAREWRRKAQSLLGVYLGADAGERVLGGLIRRGDAQTIAAALWLCDLRDFTRLSNEMPRDEVVGLLNDYFDTMAKPVVERGGEILKFIGDAMLAIFPMRDDLDRDPKCRLALEAAEHALDDLRLLNVVRVGDGKVPIKAGIGLHAGTVTYGNIGVAIGDLSRLDFTAIGPAVNFTARIQSLCKQIDRPLLASQTLASPCGSKLVRLGSYDIAGFDGQQAIYGLPE